MDTDSPHRTAPAAGGALPDPAGATFAVEQEDHSLANALRFFLNKDARVAFAGYSMPHPTEDVVNVRVQTTGKSGPRWRRMVKRRCAVAVPCPRPPCTLS